MSLPDLNMLVGYKTEVQVRKGVNDPMNTKVCRLFVAFIPLAVLGDLTGSSEQIASLSGRNRNRVAIDNLQSCEGLHGFDLAICIINRYAEEISSKRRRVDERKQNGNDEREASSPKDAASTSEPPTKTEKSTDNL
ncbi:hypothetical protein Q1695_007760 [Nippostrongylus brasiliensis]|nr:hypothetical protein Q1695_007760 [Nippostrongylus brasiliensis]